MTDTSTKPEMGSSDDSFTWTEPERTSGSQQAREWLGQLQAMIENLATQAAPVVRDIGAKAAELAAVAGEKAGPLAQRAAVFTEQAGHKLAEKSRDIAVDLRSQAAAAKAANAAGAIAGGDGTEVPAEPVAEQPMATEPMTSDEPTTSGVA
jgi:hypothetical protein